MTDYVLNAETGLIGVALTQPQPEPPKEPEEPTDGIVQ